MAWLPSVLNCDFLDPSLMESQYVKEYLCLITILSKQKEALVEASHFPEAGQAS